MKVLFIGFGSIARRHIRNLKSLLPDLLITVLRSGKGKGIPKEFEEFIYKVCLTEDELDTSYDAIFITNLTSLHYESLRKYHDFSDAFFIEKPVFLTGNEDVSIFDEVFKKYYVACPLRYTNAVCWIKENIDFSRVHSMRVISSSYLPDWRLGTDYRTTYSAHKSMGGGVSIDLIHEWDYISYLIGFPETIHSIIRKKSNLEIDSDDIAVYIAEYPDKIVEVHLDYIGRRSIRRVELFADDDTVVADLIDQKIEWLVSGGKLSLKEDRDSYQKKELEHFLRIVSGKETSDNGLNEACRVLRLSRGVL